MAAAGTTGTGPLSIDVTRLRSALGWGGAAAAGLATSGHQADIWLHNWDNNSSGGKHLIKTLCSIWTAELFTQLEGKQGWTLRGFVFTWLINIYLHFITFS